MNKPVTLVITDLDGTLLNNAKDVTPATREAIKKLKEHGILFGIASGRPVESGLVLCENWGLKDSISFLVGMNGGALYDTRTHQKDSFAQVDGELIWDIIEHFRPIPNLHYEVMVGNTQYVEWTNPEMKAVADLYGEKQEIVDLESFLKGRHVDKLVIRSTKEQQPEVIELSKSFVNPHIKGVCTSDILFEYVSPDINKGFGLQQACKHFGLNPENVVAFGDEANDLEMLILAGTGVAMNNAIPAAKAVADVVSDYTNNEDALAHFINEVVIPNAQGKLEDHVKV